MARINWGVHAIALLFCIELGLITTHILDVSWLAIGFLSFSLLVFTTLLTGRNPRVVVETCHDLYDLECVSQTRKKVFILKCSEAMLFAAIGFSIVMIGA